MAASHGFMRANPHRPSERGARVADTGPKSKRGAAPYATRPRPVRPASRNVSPVALVQDVAAGGTKPLPVSEREVQNIIGAVEEGVERPKPTIRFDIGETVKVIDGPFASFDGQVESVDEDNARLRVAVSIFGRPTPVDLEYSQVEKSAA